MTGIHNALSLRKKSNMNWIYYRGDWYRVTIVTKDKEYRLTRPGHRTHITMTRQGLARALRDYYRLSMAPRNPYG